jgi:hypothetical protein
MRRRRTFANLARSWSTRAWRVVLRLLGAGRYMDHAEQLEVQLAGCGVAASGWSAKDPAPRGCWGWSPAYQDVLELREKYEALLTQDQRGRMAVRQ